MLDQTFSDNITLGVCGRGVGRGGRDGPRPPRLYFFFEVPRCPLSVFLVVYVYTDTVAYNETCFKVQTSEKVSVIHVLAVAHVVIWYI